MSRQRSVSRGPIKNKTEQVQEADFKFTSYWKPVITSGAKLAFSKESAGLPINKWPSNFKGGYWFGTPSTVPDKQGMWVWWFYILGDGPYHQLNFGQLPKISEGSLLWVGSNGPRYPVAKLYVARASPLPHGLNSSDFMQPSGVRGRQTNRKSEQVSLDSLGSAGATQNKQDTQKQNMKKARSLSANAGVRHQELLGLQLQINSLTNMVQDLVKTKTNIQNKRSKSKDKRDVSLSRTKDNDKNKKIKDKNSKQAAEKSPITKPLCTRTLSGGKEPKDVFGDAFNGMHWHSEGLAKYSKYLLPTREGQLYCGGWGMKTTAGEEGTTVVVTYCQRSEIFIPHGDHHGEALLAFNKIHAAMLTDQYDTASKKAATRMLGVTFDEESTGRELDEFSLETEDGVENLFGNVADSTA